MELFEKMKMDAEGHSLRHDVDVMLVICKIKTVFYNLLFDGCYITSQYDMLITAYPIGWGIKL